MNRMSPDVRPKSAQRTAALLAAVGAHAVWPAVVVAIVLVAGARAQDATVPPKEVQAKLSYCEVCHGVAAQGFRGYYPIPRLAGQQTNYLENQLQAFVEHRRTNNIMFNVGHVLSPGMITALAANFKELNPKPLGGAPKDLVADGKKIFEDGVPAANATDRSRAWPASSSTISRTN